jgi:transcriptional regulator with XRE-family HTH domain
MSHLGTVLRKAREEQGITQQQVADHLGKTRPYVSRVEGGINTTTDALIDWAAFLGLKVELVPSSPPSRMAGGQAKDARLIQKFAAALPKLTPRERKQIYAHLQLVLDDG